MSQPIPPRADALRCGLPAFAPPLLAVALLALAACSTPLAGGEKRTPKAQVSFSYEGLAGLKRETLEEAASRELDAFRYSSLARADLADAAFRMESVYRARGHASALVDLRTTPQAGTPKQVSFLIAAGPRYLRKAARIRFESLAGEAIEDPDPKWRQAAEARFALPEGGLFSSSEIPFRRSEVDGAVGALQTELRLAGHRQATVELSEVLFDPPLPRGGGEVLAEAPPQGSAIPELIVRPGPRSTIGRLLAEGPAPTAEAVAEVAEQLVGKPYHRRLATEVGARTAAALGRRGYLQASVRVTEPDTSVSGPLDLKLVVTPGRPARAGPIVIEGFDRTDEDFLRKLVALESGQAFTSQDLNLARERLYRTGVLSEARLQLGDPEAKAADGPEGVAVTPLNLAVEEAEARTLDVEVGYGSYELARTSVRYRDRNFMGRARELDAQLFFSLKSYGLRVLVIDPWLIGDRDDLELSAGIAFRERPSFDETRVDFEASWVRRLGSDAFDDRHRMELGYSFSAADSEVTDEALRATVEDGSSRTAGLFARWRLDRREGEPLIPIGGNLMEASAFISHPSLLADLTFFEVSASWAGFFAFGDEQDPGSVLAVGTRITTRQPFGDDESLPLQERLFLGGESTVRSFVQDELGPAVNGEPIGGLTSTLASVEWRQRLFDPLWLGLFYDVGSVSSQAFGFKGPFGHAVGIGLRAHLPIGPVRLDFAYNPGRRFAADDAWALHFAFGFTF